MINLMKISYSAVWLSLRTLLLCVAAVVAVLTVVGCDIISDELPSYEETSIVNVGDNAPVFSIETIDGELVTVGGVRDASTLLILFSHTCPDCKNLLDALQRIINSGVVPPRILAVSRGGSLEEIVAFREENDYTFTMAANADRSIYSLYATMYVPRCYVIDSEGVVRFVTFEYSEGDVDRLFAEAQKY